ncbi:MAG TPA: TIGR02269 family lipoprotein [Archangium sp.]|nr:TIGR02269 family lipoprotein [Archangium sp.]
MPPGGTPGGLTPRRSWRNWRRTGLREGAGPRMAFHLRYREGFLPAFPRLEGRLIKHHLFPQAADLAAWFRAQGINPHDWTMVIPAHVHLRVHRAGVRGGLWNHAWRDFKNANQGRAVLPEELLAKAFELAYRFDIVGPIVPYGHTLVAPGPQMFAP